MKKFLALLFIVPIVLSGCSKETVISKFKASNVIEDATTSNVEYSVLPDNISVRIDKYKGNATDLTIGSYLTTEEGSQAYKVAEISSEVFKENNTIKTIVLSCENVKLGTAIFKDCTSLKTVVLPKDLKEIPEDTFNGCKSLDYVKIPETVTTIGERAFSSCDSLTYLTLLGSVKEVKDEAFSNCKKLKTVTFESGVKSLGRGVFSNSTELSTLMLPDSLDFIDEEAFINNDKLTVIIYDGKDTKFPWGAQNAIVRQSTGVKLYLPNN